MPQIYIWLMHTAFHSIKLIKNIIILSSTVKCCCINMHCLHVIACCLSSIQVACAGGAYREWISITIHLLFSLIASQRGHMVAGDVARLIRLGGSCHPPVSICAIYCLYRETDHQSNNDLLHAMWHRYKQL